VQSYASSLKDGTIPEGVVNSVGCHLLWQKRSADTIRMIKNYEKSLALEPQNKNAVLQLKKLNGRRKITMPAETRIHLSFTEFVAG